MPVSCKVGAFNTGTGAVNSTQDVTCGFQPKAIIFFWAGHTSATDSNTFGNGKFGMGFATQTQRCAITTTDDNGAASQASSQGHRSDACIASLTVNSTTWDGLIDIDALANWPGDGFRLIVDDVFPIDMRVGFIAYGGSDITDVDLTEFIGPAGGTAGTDQDVTIGGAFQPDIVFLLAGIAGSGASPQATAQASQVSFGVGTPTTQGVLSAGTDNGSASSDTAAYCLDAEVGNTIATSDPTSLPNRVSFVQMNADGFRVNVVEANVSAGRYFALSLRGGLWKSGPLTTTTGTSTDIAISGIGGTPKGVLVASANRAESTADTPTAPWKTSVGAATSTTERHAEAVCSSSGDGNMRVVRATENDELYINITDPGSDGADDAAGATDGLMDVFSVDADGFTFRMDDGDPSGMFAWWVMVGEAAAGSTEGWGSYGPALTHTTLNQMY